MQANVRRRGAAQIAFGPMTNEALGRLTRDIVEQAMRIIRGKRFSFKATAKGIKADGGTDWVTTADKRAQQMYVKLLRECFPLLGIVGEEDGLRIRCKIPGHNIYFTVDPLDGTAAFKRRQSDSIGTMVSLVVDDVVVMVCIGDVLTNELYYFRPGSKKTHRLDLNCEANKPQQLFIDGEQMLKDQLVLLRDPADRLRSASITTRMVDIEGGLFKNYRVDGGSIGITTAKLWKGEVGAAILASATATPWDANPVIGISTRLGFLGFHLVPGTSHTPGSIMRTELKPHDVIVTQPYDLLLIHSSHIRELATWCNERHIEFVANAA